MQIQIENLLESEVDNYETITILCKMKPVSSEDFFMRKKAATIP